MGTPAFRFCLDNSTLTQVRSIRYPFFFTIHLMTSSSCLQMYGQLLSIIVTPTLQLGGADFFSFTFFLANDMI